MTHFYFHGTSNIKAYWNFYVLLILLELVKTIHWEPIPIYRSKYVPFRVLWKWTPPPFPQLKSILNVWSEYINKLKLHVVNPRDLLWINRPIHYYYNTWCDRKLPCTFVPLCKPSNPSRVDMCALQIFIIIIIIITNLLKGQYRHDQSRLSTGHGIGVLVQDELSDWKLLAHSCSGNGNMTLSSGVLFSVTELI